MAGKKKEGRLYFYLLLIVLAVVLVVAIKYFFSFPLLFSPNSSNSSNCYDDCHSLGYECGEWSICGSMQNCGKCNIGMSCNASGKCADIQIEWENKLGENTFWFIIFIIIIPIIIIIFLLLRVWLHSKKPEDEGEVIQWSPFKKVVLDGKGKKGLDSLKE